MHYAVEAKNLSKTFFCKKNIFNLFLHPPARKKNVLAVDNVNLRVEKGLLFALLGPNGAGKTTLIKMLCSLILPCKGLAYVNGYNILTHPDKVRFSIGLVTGEERSFYWRLTGRQNLEFFCALYNLSKKEAKSRIPELLGLLGIDEPDKRFQEYSTGVKQRLAIARSLLNSPQVLFMDEPTKSLDPQAAENLRHFIKEKVIQEQGRTVFFTTHNLKEAELFADKIAIMDKGKIVADGTLEELKHSIGLTNINMEDIFRHYISKTDNTKYVST